MNERDEVPAVTADLKPHEPDRLGLDETQHDELGPTSLPRVRSEAALAGSTLAWRYDILELLGVGGMGAVYRARDRELDEIVALKVIRKELAVLPAMVERFRHEVKLARRVTHGNVARTFEIGHSDGVMFCTMELVDGESLTKRLERRGKLPVGEAVAIACAMCDGLAAAHAADVIHRDIKPDNVLIARAGRVVLADFGVAAVGVSATRELAGTLAYMAPEQARGEPATPAVDVYAVGLVLAEMLTGTRAFPGTTLEEVAAAKQRVERVVVGAEVPTELAAVIGSATTRDRELRLQSAAALRHALEPWAAAALTASPTPSARPHGGHAGHASQASHASHPSHPGHTGHDGVTTVVVLAPQAGDRGGKLYLAEAVHERLLARLVAMPGLRVLPRPVGTSQSCTYGVCFDVGDRLDITLTVESGPPVKLHFPLAVDHVESAAASIAGALDAALARDHLSDKTEALDLLLQGRHIAQRDFRRMPEALPLLERARELAPADARVAANLAIGYVRLAFFMPHLVPDGIARAQRLAHEAVADAPNLADAHLAAGHVGLNFGAPVAAASHFRRAIACAPHLAEAHEQLGRMLLEAGYQDAAIARLEDAIAIAPNLRSARWEIARAAALDARWDDHEQIIAELIATEVDRPISRARYAWWRHDWQLLAELRDKIGNLDRVLWPGLIDAVFSVYLDEGGWAARRDALLEGARAETLNRRRRAFIGQLVAEAAAFSGDHATACQLIEQATEDGLFDLHWLDRCVLLEPIRPLPAFAPIRARIKQRADAILDALYGDHAGSSDTMIA